MLDVLIKGSQTPNKTTTQLSDINERNRQEKTTKMFVIVTLKSSSTQREHRKRTREMWAESTRFNTSPRLTEKARMTLKKGRFSCYIAIIYEYVKCTYVHRMFIMFISTESENTEIGSGRKLLFTFLSLRFSDMRRERHNFLVC